MSYRGESPGKKMCRADLYLRIKDWFDAINAKKSSQAIVLCGHEAAEVPILSSIIKWKGGIIAADIDDRGLPLARYYGAIPHHGDVGRVVSDCEKIGFAHFDWTGPVYGKQMDIMVSCAKKMPTGAVLATTFLAARDVGSSLGNRQFLLKEESKTHPDWRYIAAAAGLMDALSQKGIDSEILFFARYNSGRSPMHTIAVAVFHPLAMSQFTRRRTITKCLGEMKSTTEHRYLRFSPAKHAEMLRERVLASNMTTEDIAALFNLRKPTIAAWRAHETMGTYRRHTGGGG